MSSSTEKEPSFWLGPVVIFRHLWGLRPLIWLMTCRDVQGRYRGAFLGAALPFFQPLVMLAVYTFVFSEIFNARWGIDADASKTSFALILFLGLITFRIISEMINTAPELVTRHANFVKKVVFPLEILPVVRLLSILVDVGVSLIVLLIGVALFRHPVFPEGLLLPIIWLPLIFLSMSCGYLFAAVGVFFRDLRALAGIITTFLFFSSAIFFPMSRVPERFQIFFSINPVAVFVECSRKLVFWGELPDIYGYCLWLLLSVVMWSLSVALFMRFKKAFADVI